MLESIARRLRAQRLTGEPHATAAEAVAWSGAVQAQEFPDAKWSLGMRIAGATDASVEAAFARGEFVRVHALRPTWHFVAPADLRWIQRLTAARVHKLAAYYFRQQGLTPRVLSKAHAAIERALADGPLPRRDLLPAVGLDNPVLGNALMHAELECLIVSGPRRGKQHTYRLADGVIPPAPERSREEDLAELATRYVRSHADATEHDFAWWSSLTVTEARAGLAAARERLDDDAGDPPPPPPALLLPTYDELIVAHRSHRTVGVDGEVGHGLVNHPLLLDGRLAGEWRRTIRPRAVEVSSPVITDAVRDAADRYGAFLGLPAELTPLRTPG
jgi:hypothetical protein